MDWQIWYNFDSRCATIIMSHWNKAKIDAIVWNNYILNRKYS